MPSLPSPIRVALGLAATVVDEARRLPDKAIELPMLAVSRALQLSLRAQQRYSALAARGDELLAARSTVDDVPPWATFDDEPVDEAPTPRRPSPDAEAALRRAEAEVEALEPAADPLPAPAAKRTPKPRPSKTVRAPRAKKPSAFDTVGDDDGTDEDTDGGTTA